MNLAVPAGEERCEVGTQKERIRPGKIDVPPSPGMDTVDRPLEALAPLHLVDEEAVAHAVPVGPDDPAVQGVVLEQLFVVEVKQIDVEAV